MRLTGKEAIMIHSSMKAIGDVECILCDAKKIYDVCEKIFGIEENCVIEKDSIPEEWWK